MHLDDTFGPRLPGAFDFTILWEQSILSLLPTAIFIIVASWRIAHIYRRDAVVRPGLLLWAKLAVTAAFIALQVTLVALWSLDSTPRTRTSIPEAVVGVVEGIAIAGLSYVEHIKSARPSPLLSTYLFLTIILDVALARTFIIRDGLFAISAVFTAALALKFILLILEELPKRRSLISENEVVRETSVGVISRTLFLWLNPLLWRGTRSVLTVDNLGPLHQKLQSKPLLDQLERAWDNDSKEGGMALLRVTVKSYRTQFLAGVVPRLALSAFTFAQPFLIESVINTVAKPPEENRGKTISGLIGATVLLYTGMAVAAMWYRHMTFQLVTMYRGGLASLVFKKTLRLDGDKTGEAAPVTLMSTDVEGLAEALNSIHDLWSAFIELPVGIYLLYRQVGIPSLFVLVPAIASIVGGGIIAKDMGPARVRWSQAIQERIGATSSSLSQMKGVKMIGLSGTVQATIQKLRLTELGMSTQYRWILVRLSVLANITNEFTPIVIILSAIFWTKADSGFTVATVFTSLALIGIVSGPVMLLIVSGMQLATALGCFTRLQTFLLQEERLDKRELPVQSSKTSRDGPSTQDDIELMRLASPLAETQELIDPTKPMVRLQNAGFKVGEEVQILHELNYEARQRSLNMIIGRVGCGKTSLLKAIAGELPLAEGTISVQVPSMAYCDQIPWLQNISIRDNIIGQSPPDEQWLKTVLHACALDEDVSLLAKGDRSIVGTGGVALSGGQKQRVALARAVFAKKRLVILDDVFSGLDSKTARAVFSRVLGSEGLLRASGATVILCTHNIKLLPAADFITILDEGRVTHNQVLYSSLDTETFKALDTKRGKQEQDNDTSGESTSDEEDKPAVDDNATSQELDVPTEADLARRTGDIDCYKIYLSALGFKMIFIFFFSVLVHSVMYKMPQIFIRLWTEEGKDFKEAGFVGGFVSFAVASNLFAGIATIVICIYGVPKAGRVLHTKLLNTVLNAALRFFTTVDSGITLNRFSQDISLIDEQLPMTFFTAVALAMRVLAEVGIIASGATYVAAIIPGSVIALYFVQKYYLHTSRQMRLLDIETKSPLYTQFTETLAGLQTIRAFGWAPQLLQDNHRRLDASQKPFYGMYCIQRWLQVVLDLFVAGMALVLVSFSLSMSGTTSSGAIGLALVNLIGFNQTLTLLINQWTELETSLGAIARLKWFFTNTPDENKPEESEEPSATWPAKGAIELRNVSAAYGDNLPLVIRDLSLKIQPGQKVGVCGRSGSGKSSLVLTLLRLLELREGEILIDGEDVSKMPRATLRTQLTTLPQDPLTVPGTVRQNVDPASTIQSDAPLITALTQVNLWDTLSSRGGLDATLLDLGLSSGQLQLLCLARAMLSRGSIVLLDEATSNVDHQTEEEIRRVIKEEMSDKTVVEVAHRLDIIRECDVVVVMAEGRLQEVGAPEDLLARDSAFKALWESQGL
ncbi:ABC transporter domain-containing protein [Sarocladium implicatum]|nr:ABC transporter domain-containing protein [Sarocladium implicatum]